MATTAGRRRGVKRQESQAGAEAAELVTDQLEEPARQGAREMLMEALLDEGDAYLGRRRYERSGEASRCGGNGDGALGLWAATTVRQPAWWMIWIVA